MVAVRRDLHTPAVRIRPMHDADLAAVAELERSSYLFPWTEGIFRDCVRVGYVCRVMEIEGQIVGYGVLSTGAGEAHILNVCVADEYRCRGLGRHLLEHLLDRARGFGVREAFLEVRPSNTTAIRLYQSMGFEQIGIRRGYYQASTGREDAVVLKLDLKPG
jgi:ribosomal-protein-alanine N-acetyltransferase